VLAAIARLGLEHHVIFNKGAVMVLPPGMNKASGLKVALGELGLSPRNTVACGDGENDHALLELSEYAVATANAVQPLKDAADWVTRETHGDGVLEVVADLIETDLARLAPKRRRRALCIGKDRDGRDVVFPSRRASVLVTGENGGTNALGKVLLERLCRTGYQFCVLDTEGAYLDFKPAVAFGTLTNPPSVQEVLTAMEKPDVQAVVCLAAVPREERHEFVERLLIPLRELRAATGRPHWILVDEAHDLLPASAEADDSPATGAENTLYVTDDPMALAPASSRASTASPPAARPPPRRSTLSRPPSRGARRRCPRTCRATTARRSSGSAAPSGRSRSSTPPPSRPTSGRRSIRIATRARR
jgi:hypothetical protein